MRTNCPVVFLGEDTDNQFVDRKSKIKVELSYLRENTVRDPSSGSRVMHL